MREPRILLGLFLLAASASPLIEGIYLVSFPEMGIALLLGAIGWWLRRPVSTFSRVDQPGVHPSLPWRWIRFSAVAIPTLLLAYVLSYVAFMDRCSPTDPKIGFKRFPSSFRWAPRIWVSKGSIAYALPWRVTTIWNVVYDPMDRVWFHFVPRPRAEEQQLRALGYYK